LSRAGPYRGPPLPAYTALGKTTDVTEARMPTATIPTILPDGIYDDGSLCAVLGVGAQTLAKARRDGSLRYARKGQRTLYLGAWVLEWLTVDKRPRTTGEGSREP